MSTFIVWLNPQRGKVKRILLSDWLPEQGPSSPLRNCRIGLAIKSSLFWPYNKFLIPKLVRSRWLDISFILFCVFIDLDFVSVHKNAAKKKTWPISSHQLTSRLINNAYFILLYSVLFMVKSLRLDCIARLISNSDDNWKAIPNFYFDKYGGLPCLLKCNYSTVTLDNNLPLFYRELLDYFKELTKFSEYDKNNDLILWNNRRITIERNSVFWKQWFDQGVTLISLAI